MNSDKNTALGKYKNYINLEVISMWVMLLLSAIFLLLLFGCTDRDETIEQLMDSALGHIEHSKAELLYDEIFEIEIPTDEKYDVEELKREMEYAEENTK